MIDENFDTMVKSWNYFTFYYHNRSHKLHKIA